MMSLGVLSGISGISFLESFGLIVSDIFIKIFKCISTPIIALSIIVTLSSYQEDGLMPNVWRKTMLYTISTTMLAAIVACILYLIINPNNVNDVSQTMTSGVANNGTYLQHLTSLIPSNVFAPFLEQQVIGVLLVGFIFGIAIRFIPDPDAKLAVTNFFKGMHGIFFVITKWVVKILPLGLYGFVTATVIQLNKGMDITGIGKYLLVIVLANLIQGFVILPAWLKLNRINPFKAMQKMMPALSVAFFSKSSAGTLPVTIETAEKRLKIDPKISRFVLPLCTSINMNGCAAFIFTTVIFLMQNHGMDITLATMGCWIVIATIAAIGNAGVPMGCFFLSASLLSSMNVPIILLGIILPFYSVIDMIETALNVWSDSCVANVVNQHYLKHKEDVLMGDDVVLDQH
ncbi:MAG: dicarboxylate/amino acid:cation symporter [Gammaproteobacteria bacterium]